MTAIYERSRAGAVMLNIAVAVLTDPIAMQFRQTLKITTNQTAFTGVCVYLLIRDRNLGVETLAGILLATYKVFLKEEKAYEE